MDAPTPDPELARDALIVAAGRELDALEMLRVVGRMHTETLPAYLDSCIIAARKTGTSWTEVGRILGMARQNARRKFMHLDPRGSE